MCREEFDLRIGIMGHINDLRIRPTGLGKIFVLTPSVIIDQVLRYAVLRVTVSLQYQKKKKNVNYS
jgi:hypothetical protein